MNSRDGAKSGSCCLSRSNSNAAPIALAVQLPIRPWSYTAGHWPLRSTAGGSWASARRGAEYRKSRESGRSGRQPYLEMLRIVGSVMAQVLPVSTWAVVTEVVLSQSSRRGSRYRQSAGPPDRTRALKVTHRTTEDVAMITGVFDAPATAGTTSRPALFCRVGDRLLAIPLACVVEIMRPLPVQAFAGTPPFVLGVSTIRGAVLPVVDIGTLLGGNPEPATRFVTIVQDDRSAALAVTSVIGVQALDDAGLQELPPLLESVDLDTVSSIGSLDTGLLLVLGETHLVPDSVWALRTEQVTTS